MAKLDRFHVSTEWDLIFSLSLVKALPRITSDHSPLLLSLPRKAPAKLFRFERVWLSRADFCDLVSIWWNKISPKHTSSSTFAAKLRHCRKRIKDWCATNFYAILRTKRTLADEIHKLDALEESQNLTPTLLERRKQLKTQLSCIIGDEEILWKSRAKQHWLAKGDGNTKFFHGMANGRKRTNHIAEIVDDGRRLVREQDKSAYFFRMFKERFDPGSPTPKMGDWSGFFIGTTALDDPDLTSSFTPEEIKKATFDLKGDKASGPDGFGLDFFHKF